MRRFDTAICADQAACERDVECVSTPSCAYASERRKELEKGEGETHELAAGRTDLAREDVVQLFDDLQNMIVSSRILCVAKRKRTGERKRRTGRLTGALTSLPHSLLTSGPKCAKPVSSATSARRGLAIKSHARCGWRK